MERRSKEKTEEEVEEDKGMRLTGSSITPHASGLMIAGQTNCKNRAKKERGGWEGENEVMETGATKPTKYKREKESVYSKGISANL